MDIDLTKSNVLSFEVPNTDQVVLRILQYTASELLDADPQLPKLTFGGPEADRNCLIVMYPATLSKRGKQAKLRDAAKKILKTHYERVVAECGELTKIHDQIEINGHVLEFIGLVPIPDEKQIVAFMLRLQN